MEMQRTGSGRSRWWPPVFGLAIAAVALLRIAGAGGRDVFDWTQRQAADRRAAEVDAGLRFLCVDDMAFVLDDGAFPLVPESEDRLMPSVAAEARAACRPPGLALPGGFQIRLSATAPVSGYRAHLFASSARPVEAVERLSAALRERGWTESGGSRVARQRQKLLSGRLMERDGAWLLAVGFDAAVGEQTAVVLVGRYSLPGEANP